MTLRLLGKLGNRPLRRSGSITGATEERPGADEGLSSFGANIPLISYWSPGPTVMRPKTLTVQGDNDRDVDDFV